ncbi:hypothetical protein DL98DRAFT_654875 [Cadophora sp. DSE1049]|nr:hypothetical protein DL98DRAFT_654875 [Cadophora sp. DSE1049]
MLAAIDNEWKKEGWRGRFDASSRNLKVRLLWSSVLLGRVVVTVDRVETRKNTVILWSKPVEDLIARNHKLYEAIEPALKIQLRGCFGKFSKFSGSGVALPCLILPRSAHRNRNRCRSTVADKDQHMERSGGMIRNGKDTDPTLPNQPFR